MTAFWEQQWADRVCQSGRPGFVTVFHGSSAAADGCLFASGRFLLTEGAATVLGLLDPSHPDHDRYADVTDPDGGLAAVGLREYSYVGDDADLPRLVAELRTTAKRAARAAAGQPGAVREGACDVALHHVLTGTATWIPKGHPAEAPAPAPTEAAAQDWGSGPAVLAVVDTGLDLASSTGSGATTDPAAPVGPGGTVLVLDMEEDRDLLLPELPDGSRGPHLAAQAGHGTFVTWVAERMAGGGARIVDVRALDPDGVGTEAMLLDALARLEDACPDLDVINLSLGGYADGTDYSGTDATAEARDRDEIPLGIGRWLRQYADTHIDTVIVCAAGNEGVDGRQFWPAADDRVVAVASLRSDLEASEFTNTGDWVDVCTLGEQIVGDFPTGDFATGPQSLVHLSGGAVWSGTSFATPVVAGEIVRRAAEDRAAGVVPASGRAAYRALLADIAGRPGPAGCGLIWDPRDRGREFDPTAP